MERRRSEHQTATTLPKLAGLGRELPYNLDAEEGLLGACIIDGGKEMLTLCLAAKLTPDAFYKPAHQIIFRVLADLFEANAVIDEVVLADKLLSRTVSTLDGRKYDPEGSKPLLEYIGGDMAIARLTSRLETTVFAPHYLTIVKEKHLLRRLIATCTSVVERCYTQQDELPQFVATVEQELFALSQDQLSDAAMPIAKAVQDAAKTVKLLMERKGSLSGVASGLVDLDKMLLGFQRSEMIVLAARPSMGKTAMALTFVLAASVHTSAPVRTLCFSLEMSAESLTLRMLCMLAKVDAEKLRSGFLSAKELESLQQAGQRLRTAPLLIDESSDLTITTLRAKARREHAAAPLGLIVIDYLQLMHPTDHRVPREQQVAEMSRGIKAMAKELKIPVVVLCQLNRESEKENRAPRPSDLRESGSIEQDADVVLMLYRKKDNETAIDADFVRDLLVAKQRNGPTGNVRLSWQPYFTLFTNYAPN